MVHNVSAPDLKLADVLTISPNPTLSVYFSGLFDQFGWAVVRRDSCESAIDFLRRNRAAVAICEEELPDGGWKSVIRAAGAMPDPPSFVVIGEEAPLWKEVSRLGGFDVLTRPLREADVVWTVASAWHHWMKQTEMRDQQQEEERPVIHAG